MRFPHGRSVTLRLTLLFGAVSTSVLLLLGVVVGRLVERHFEELDLALLGGKLQLIRHAFADVGTRAELDMLPKRLDESLVGHHGLSVRILTADGRVLYASAQADFPHLPGSHGPEADSGRATGADGRPLRLLSGEATTGLPGSPPVTVELATDLSHHEVFMASFRAALWMTVGLAVLVSGVLGWVAARKGLAPLRDISRNVARITARRLDRRLPMDSIPRELAEVARTLNEMLARLEESFRRLSDFSSDLAHELRTPVSNLLTETQVMLSRSRTADEYREVLASNAEEYERLSRTIADMLFLAKADNDLIVPTLERVDVRAETDGVLEFYGVLAEENGIRLTVEGQEMVTADRLMLRRALGNLLSNAFRHTPDGGRVQVRIQGSADGMTTIAVGNTGDTIAPEHLPRLFDRFYRADPSRRGDTEGTGLGLAITRSIVRAHGGAVSVRSTEGFTVFELRFPA